MAERSSRLLRLLRDQSPTGNVLTAPATDLGLAEVEPFPFLAIVGQEEMKLALLLAIVNPNVGGVLLIGSRGTGKTTAVRSLADLLPLQRRSLCPEGCTEETLDSLGMEGLCENCAKRVGYGEPLTAETRVRIVELPLNARLDDVVGGIDERMALEQNRLRLRRGILAQADGNVLYVDEVNLLNDSVTDAILDAAAQGYYTVRRGALNLQYWSRFSLVGSMNPEEGNLRPQIMDRFGLRVVVRGLSDPDQRYQAYEQALAYRTNPDRLAALYAQDTLTMAEEIAAARQRLPRVTVGDEAKQIGLDLIRQMKVDSMRAEITLFEAARAHAAADDREAVLPRDIGAVSLIALRLRQSEGLEKFHRTQRSEDEHLTALLPSHLRAQISGDGESAP
ncbi:MAG: ATP-binding protein [Chloroflexota bacterium]|jgi:magnesium chelatase subunit I